MQRADRRRPPRHERGARLQRDRGGAALAWVVLDLNGTLLDPAEVGLEVLDEAILSAMTLNHVGEYRPFSELLRAAGGSDAVLEAAARMPAFPEARAALDRLAGAGLRLAVLTNSATEAAERGLRTAGLRDRFEHVIGTDQVGVFKPDARVYEHGLSAIGARPHEATMVAAHWWDLRGARAAGMRVAWVGRGGRAPSSLLPSPDAQGPDLAAVAEAMAAGLSRRSGPG